MNYLMELLSPYYPVFEFLPMIIKMALFALKLVRGDKSPKPPDINISGRTNTINIFMPNKP